MEEIDITLIYASSDKSAAEKFKEDVSRNLGNQISFRFTEYVVKHKKTKPMEYSLGGLTFRDEVVANKGDILNAGRELAELFFNDAIGLRIQAFSEKGESQTSGPASVSNYFDDDRSLAEFYVLAKMFGINSLPAVVINGNVLVQGRMPTVEEVASKLNVTIEPADKKLYKEHATVIEEEQKTTEPSSETLYVHIEEEPKIKSEETTIVVDADKSKGGLEGLDEESRTRVLEILSRTRFRGPDECSSCFYYIENESRCALLHVAISDPKHPLCRLSV